MVISPRAQLFVIKSAGCFSQYMGDYDTVANIDERICANLEQQKPMLTWSQVFQINIKFRSMQTGHNWVLVYCYLQFKLNYYLKNKQTKIKQKQKTKQNKILHN